MSGTYQIDGSLFIENPIQKQWRRQNVGTGTSGKPISETYWTIGFSFSTLSAGSGTASAQLMQLWLNEGLHTAIIPNPITGELSLFSGVAIDMVNFVFTDVDRDKWVGNATMQLSHISLASCWDI